MVRGGGSSSCSSTSRTSHGCFPVEYVYIYIYAFSGIEYFEKIGFLYCFFLLRYVYVYIVFSSYLLTCIYICDVGRAIEVFVIIAGIHANINSITIYYYLTVL